MLPAGRHACSLDAPPGTSPNRQRGAAAARPPVPAGGSPAGPRAGQGGAPGARRGRPRGAPGAGRRLQGPAGGMRRGGGTPRARPPPLGPYRAPEGRGTQRGGARTAAAPPRQRPGGARQRPRPGSAGPGPNLPPAARAAPAAAAPPPPPPLQHGRPRSAGSAAHFRFRLLSKPRPSRRRCAGIGHAHLAPPVGGLRPRPLRPGAGREGIGHAHHRGHAHHAARARLPWQRPLPSGAGSGAAAPVPVPVPVAGAMSGRAGRRRLVLHVDINNTVLPADTVCGHGPREALNGFLCTATWGRAGAGGEWQWVSDRPSLQAPCPDAVSYHCRYGRNLAFTEGGVGQRFGGLHARYLQLLAWPGEPHEELSLRDGQGECYHLLLPSFYRLLDALHRDGRAFAVVFRTFGTDLPRVLRALHCALDGQHPQFPALRDLALSVDLTPGQIRCSKREVVLRRGAERLATREDGRKLYDYFSSLEGVGGFQDHFDWWARNQFSSQGGKPLWIDPHDPSVHHIFIDDNIRLDDADTIVRPQVFSERGSSSPRCAPTSELYDVCLVRTDLLEAITDEDYFLRCVRRCEENYDRYLARVGSSSPSQQCDGQ